MDDVHGECLATRFEQDYEFITAKDMEEAKKLMATHGVQVVKSFMESKLDNWKSQPLHCAVTGSSGTGKSSFINSVRNLTAEDHGAAEVDVTECTTEPTSYQDPVNPLLQYWDLPGVGTPNYPKDETYLQKVDFQKYDFFLIISANRFSENDIWLALQVRKSGKKFFFVRSKIDQDLENEKRTHPKRFNEHGIKEKIRNNCIKELEKGDIRETNVFLISNFHSKKYEFPDLCLALIKALPRLKREAMALSLHSFSNEMVVEKRNVLQKRIWVISAISAAGALAPIPGLSLVVDTALIINELTLYKEQFGLDEKSLAELSCKLSSDKKDLLSTCKAVAEIGTKDNLMHLFRSYSQSLAAEEVSRYIVGIGWLVASAISFATTYRMLQEQLNRLEKASDEVMALTLETLAFVDELD